MAAKQKEDQLKASTAPTTVVSPPVTTSSATPSTTTPTPSSSGGKYDHIPESMRKTYEERMRIYKETQASIFSLKNFR